MNSKGVAAPCLISIFNTQAWVWPKMVDMTQPIVPHYSRALLFLRTREFPVSPFLQGALFSLLISSSILM